MSQAILNKNIKQNKNTKNYKNFFIFIRVMILSSVLNHIISNFFQELNHFKKYHISSISQFKILGKQHFTNDENLKKQINILITSNNFITLDSKKIKKELQSIIGIEKISINKKWPNILKINLVEYKPYAKWNNNYFINLNGDIFLLPKNTNNNFISLKFFGPKNSQQKILKMYNSLEKKFKQHNFLISSISMNIRESWKLILSNNIELNLGKKNINERIERFIKSYPLVTEIKNKKIKYIDLRYNHGFAVK